MFYRIGLLAVSSSAVGAMKILCMCKQGIVRSGALAWILKTEFKQDAVSVGYETNGYNLHWFLQQWADKIICLDRKSLLAMDFEGENGSKRILFDVGEDRWHDPSHPELHYILRQMIHEKLHNCLQMPEVRADP